MCFLLNIGIFQPAMLVYQRVRNVILFDALPATSSKFAPENRPKLLQKETIVFQPSFLRCYFSFREGFNQWWVLGISQP